MNDILHSQEIQRRPRTSLPQPKQNYKCYPIYSVESGAQNIARRRFSLIYLKKDSVLNNSFNINQRLSKRKKKRLLEKIRISPRRQAFETSPHFSAKTDFQKNYRSRNSQNPVMEKTAAVIKTAVIQFLKIPQKLLLAFVILFTAIISLAIVNIDYIPPPEPPEESITRELNAHGNLEYDYGDIIPLDLTETFDWQYYTVRSGDSVEALARRYGLSLDAIIASNNLQNVRRLRIGSQIRIPNMDGIPYTAKSGDTFNGIAASMGVPLEAILDANDVQDDLIDAGMVFFIPGARMDRTELRRALGELWIWPLSGRITSGFGWRNDPFTGLRSFHAALDISTPTGTPVRAASDGRVSSTGFNSLYGHFIIISHSENYQTMYAHLNRVLVRGGAYINQGTIIAHSGNSGRSTGPHLHFAVYRNNRAINPLEALNR